MTTAATVAPRLGDAPPMQTPNAHQPQGQQSSSIAYSMPKEIRELADSYKHAVRNSLNAAQKASQSENEALPFSFVVGDGQIISIKPQPTNEDHLQNGDHA